MSTDQPTNQPNENQGQPQGQPQGQGPGYPPGYGQGSTVIPPAQHLPEVKKKKRRVWLWVLIGVLALVLIFVVACSAVVAKSVGDAVASAAPENASVAPSDPTESASDAADPSPEPSASESSEAADENEAKIGQTLTYTDGVSVKISKVKQSKISEYAAGGHTGDPLTIITIKVTNKTDHNLDGDELSVEASYGSDGDSAEDVFDSQVGDSMTGTIRKGKSKSGVYGFAIPKKHLNDVTIEVTADYDHAPAIFTGSVK